MTSKQIATIIEQIIQLQKSQDRFIIAIDGRGGAGKSTLANQLATQLKDIIHLEYDWFHLPAAEVTQARRYDQERFKEEISTPFLSGEPVLRFRQYNWGDLAEKVEELSFRELSIAPRCGMIIEGCETLHKELLSVVSLGIWVETPAPLAYQRGVARDIEQYGLNKEKVLPLWDEWIEWEKESLFRDNRMKRAQIVFEGNSSEKESC